MTQTITAYRQQKWLPFPTETEPLTFYSLDRPAYGPESSDALDAPEEIRVELLNGARLYPALNEDGQRVTMIERMEETAPGRLYDLELALTNGLARIMESN